MTQQAAPATGSDPQFKRAFSSFSTNGIGAARRFYGETLHLDVVDSEEGGLELRFESGQSVFIYPKDNHEPATFTVLNLMVDDIAAAVQKLKTLGIAFESYDGDIKTDDMGIFWGGRENKSPNIAWFKDPAGNVISVIEERSSN